MIRVTAIYEGCEIGHGEGDGYEYAMNDCVDSIAGAYIDHAADDVILRAVSEDHSAIAAVETPLAIWLSVTA